MPETCRQTSQQANLHKKNCWGRATWAEQLEWTSDKNCPSSSCTLIISSCHQMCVCLGVLLVMYIHSRFHMQSRCNKQTWGQAPGVALGVIAFDVGLSSVVSSWWRYAAENVNQLIKTFLKFAHCAFLDGWAYKTSAEYHYYSKSHDSIEELAAWAVVCVGLCDLDLCHP